MRFCLSPLLLPASAFYALGLRIDRVLSSSRRRSLPVPTISIGNLTVGGTGKTPILLRVVSDLREIGRRPFVLTRGYSGVGSPDQSGVVRSAEDAASFSDEVRLMAELLSNIPIGVGADRVASADKILSGGKEDVAVLDDGFQHWRVARDLDIVCVDATSPWGGGFLIPMGRLRETRCGLVRAGVIVITRCEAASADRVQAIVARARRASPDALILCSRFTLSLTSTEGRAAPVPARALAVSAIGNPGAFEANLRALGVAPESVRFGDHHSYSTTEWVELAARSRKLGLPIVTTAKDWVKLRTFVGSENQIPVLIAVQSLAFDDEDAWTRRLRALLANR